MKQFISFIRKEFYHIFRDVRTMAILLIMPVIFIILFGYAITTEIKLAPIAVFDQSRDELTRKITEELSANEYFELYKQVDSYAEAQELLRQSKVTLAVIFPPQFASTPDAQVQILADASNPNEATQLTAYTSSVLAQQIEHKGVQSVVKLLYNPLMKGSYNFVPGVMGLIMILICAMMTSVGIVREKELGTMEVLLVSPMKPLYIIIAKTIPYLLLSIVNIATILLLAYFLLEVPMNGSLLLVIFISLLYALVSLCLGVLISTVAETQQSAMLMSGFVLMLPVILLSGMMFPVENMPAILQYISHIVPAKWYIIALKDVMIKGLSFGDIWQEVIILTAMLAGIIGLSVKRFKVRL